MSFLARGYSGSLFLLRELSIVCVFEDIVPEEPEPQSPDWGQDRLVMGVTPRRPRDRGVCSIRTQLSERRGPPGWPERGHQRAGGLWPRAAPSPLPIPSAAGCPSSLGTGHRWGRGGGGGHGGLKIRLSPFPSSSVPWEGSPFSEERNPNSQLSRPRRVCLCVTLLLCKLRP